MAELVNLKRVRKRRDRAAAAQAATESRIRHGLTKAERAKAARQAAQATAALDGARLAAPDPADGQAGGQAEGQAGGQSGG